MRLIFTLILVCVFGNFCFSQKNNDISGVIYVGTAKNTYISISGTELQSLDVGGDSDNIAFEIQEGTSIVKLKGLKANFPETNMLVVGSDTLLQFIIKYSANPDQTLYKYNVGNPGKKPSATGKNKNTTSEVKEDEAAANNSGEYDKVYKLRPNLYCVDMVSGVKGTLNNIAASKERIYFVLNMVNASKIDYGIDYANFEIRTKSRSLRNSSGQSTFPEFQADPKNPKMIAAGTEQKLFFSLEKFALRSDESVFVTIYEKSNISKGRQLRIKADDIDFKKIINIE